ncbi:MAG: hypothetical protein ACYS0G_01685 [Planctomycetota bacterium]|jgi:hypothetical protein
MAVCTTAIPTRVRLFAGLVLTVSWAAAGADQRGPEADEASPARLDLTTERVVVFKDGYGLFVKSASAVADADGCVYTDQVPPSAVLGTFWAVADGREILSLRAEWIEQKQETEQETDCLTTVELLRANRGKHLQLEMSYGDRISGTLLDVLELPPGPARITSPSPAPDHGARHTIGSSAAPLPHPAGTGGQFAVVQTDTAELILPVASVRTIGADDLATRMVRRTQTIERTKRLSVDLGPDAGGRRVTIRIFYFTPGIRWIPTYRLGGELKSEGRLTLQGEILNEVEDIDGAAFDLVVGVPNFRYKGTISPLSMERVMRNALRLNAPGLMGQSMQNATFAQRAGEWRGHDPLPAPPDAGDVTVLASELTATGEQDLFVYSVDSLRLSRGARATVSLWESNIPLRHVYTMDVGVVRDWRSGAAFVANDAPRDPASQSPLRLARNAVWHQLELANNSSVPWTTGPAMLLRSFLPLGQELLTYTPRGGRCLLPVTVAVDVRGTYEEEEIERVGNAVRWGGYQWARVRKKGAVTVTNYRKESIEALVAVDCGGKAESASDDGTIKIDGLRAEDWNGGGSAINNHSEMSWQVTLGPGETRTLTYTASYYVR